MLKTNAARPKLNHISFAVLMRTLMDDPSTCYELAEETGLSVKTVQALMRMLWKYKVVHISAWESDTLGRDCTPVFTLGTGKNVGRRRASDRERYRNMRLRQIAANVGAKVEGV